jgi:uncharacterized protein
VATSEGRWSLDAGKLAADTALVEQSSECDRAECLELLATTSLGRVVSVRHGLPSIVPVRFWVVDDDIHFRTSSGEVLENALARAVVGFEADGWSDQNQIGWVVEVHGRLVELFRPDELARLGISDDPSQPSLPRGHVLRISTDVVQGRWLQLDQPIGSGAERPSLQASVVR